MIMWLTGLAVELIRLFEDRKTIEVYTLSASPDMPNINKE